MNRTQALAFGFLAAALSIFHLHPDYPMAIVAGLCASLVGFLAWLDRKQVGVGEQTKSELADLKTQVSNLSMRIGFGGK